MKNRNEEKIKEILDCNICEYSLYDDGCPQCKLKQAVLKMAEWKDERIKQFFVEHVDVPFDGEITESGPYAKDYLNWMEERFKAAEDFFEKYKQFE